ncbi:hypothetical protein [Bradyrhizobium sp.]|uniref:hypothetical protein n=1 Tax=Bradyrhizobium sp. TaxID=376 RepID=UPI002C79878D|nr:hypothetical protein [Bradyrhizobium sp.]HMM89208.1 hypothetical protein [Bradyrhizobium sp.]
MSDRDWNEIKNQLNELVPVPMVPEEEQRPLPKQGIRRAIQADEEALLAHITDALARES